jgi:hypothetical protein
VAVSTDRSSAGDHPTALAMEPTAELVKVDGPPTLAVAKFQGHRRGEQP